MKKILTYLAATIAGGYATIATAQPITFNVDIGSAAQIYNGLAIAPDPANGTNWNNLNPASSGPAVTISNLANSLGTVFPGVNVTMFAAGNSMHFFDTTANTTPNPTALMRDYSFFRTYTVTVSGLEAGNYEMYFYGHGDANNQGGILRIAAPYGAYTNQTCNCADGRNIYAPGNPGVSYLNPTNLTVGADGKLIFTVVNYMNGFQLRPSQPQGPAFVVTGADGCSDVGVTPGIAGSVTTNDYMLYLNGAYVGPTIAGTGAALNFGVQTAVGNYTIVATNSATAMSGLMYGSVRVYAPGVTIDTQPASVAVVSNLPAAFAVAASGDSLTYQWYKDGNLLSNSGAISGAQTPTLSISAVQPANAGNYTVVVQNPCSGAGVTSAPPATLTVTAPRNLIWVGGVVGSDWNLTDQEFTFLGSPTAFGQGDTVTFNDSSSFQSVTISNNLTPTSVTVTGTKAYSLSGPNKLTGVSSLAHSSSGTLSILNVNDATGGTTVASGSTLQLGDGANAGNNGNLAGTITISSGATNFYNYAGSGSLNINLAHSWAGSGTIECSTVNGSILHTPQNANSSGFNGTININGFTTLHPSGVGGGVNMLGFGSTVNILQDGGQLWIDPPGSGVYSNVLNIQGNGRLTDVPALGAIRIFNSTLIGSINLLANTRIGGSISGGTIRSTISGPYQLEVLGTTIANYVLQLGPTNGTHSYSSTLITAGTIQALNNNAISSGPLTIDNAGTLRVNGNNVSVASLTSLNTGTVTGPSALVYNNHATAVGVLTVGSDNTSSSFDGVFGNGGAAALGLTKVGTGTLTLSQVSTNSGTVAVNGGTIAMTGVGAFTRASVIVGSGAFFDVIGAGGTATFGAGQTLGGNGTVTGNVAANSGSTIAPGTSVGTLTVAGNVTLGGNMVMEMNRSLVQNSDRLVTSGGAITGGGALTNVNIGPVLQVGDTFQFFASGVSGITANLQTVDFANAVTYTWNNNLAVNGTVSVASVTPIAPPTLIAVKTGNTIAFSWSGPFKLQAQTNSLSVGISTNWANYPGGTASPVNVTINPTNRTVFYRLSLQ